MADAKISALVAATTPLAGTEVVPVVQSSSTKNVSIANLTAGRAVAMRDANLTGGAAVINIGATADNTYHYVRTIDNDGQAVYFGNDNAAGSFFGAGAYGRVLYSEGAKPVKVFVNGAYRAEYDTSGNYKLDTGNLVIGTSGKGIDFSATSGTGTSELLADYEEGTWTPTDASGAGLTFSGVSATYTKVGRQVICNLLMSYPVTASSATAVIAGLPFAAGSFGICTIQGVFCVRNSSFTSYGVNGGGGSSSFNFDKNSGTANATNADLSNTFFALTITYQA